MDKDLKLLNQIESITDMMNKEKNSFKKSFYADKIVDLRKMLVDINKKAKGGIIKKFEEGGDVKKNGKSRFILPNADYDLNDPNFMRFIKRKMKKEGITQQEAIDSFKSDVVKHNKAKGNPGFINYKKGGVVLAPKGGSAHYKSKKSSKAIAKKYFKGIF